MGLLFVNAASTGLLLAASVLGPGAKIVMPPKNPETPKHCCRTALRRKGRNIPGKPALYEIRNAKMG
jgi:hypothetical protein